MCKRAWRLAVRTVIASALPVLMAATATAVLPARRTTETALEPPGVSGSTEWHVAINDGLLTSIGWGARKGDTLTSWGGPGDEALTS